MVSSGTVCNGGGGIWARGGFEIDGGWFGGSVVGGGWVGVGVKGDVGRFEEERRGEERRGVYA